MTDEFSTAYSRIRQYVFTRIAAAAPEESSLCLTTERELCELFAASRGTVRRALQMLVDEGLLVRRPHHGTFIHPAVLNSAGQQKLIGLIILNGELAYWDSYILALLHGVAEGFAGTPYQVRHINFMGDPAQTIRVMATSRLSGLLWLGPMESVREYFGEFRKQNIPIVTVIPQFEADHTVSCFTIDFEKYGELVSDRLLETGRRNFVLLDSNTDGRQELKSRGVRRALAARGLPFRNGMVRNVTPITLDETLSAARKELGELDAAVVPTNLRRDAARLLAGTGTQVVAPDMDLAPSPGPPESFRVVIPVADLARQAAAHLTRRLDNPRLSPEHLMLKPVITGPPGPA